MSGWQPIATAPKDGTEVLLVIPCLEQPVRIGRYNVTETFRNGKSDYRHEGWSWGQMRIFGYEDMTPTHWMPLPRVPTSMRSIAETPCVEGVNSKETSP